MQKGCFPCGWFFTGVNPCYTCSSPANPQPRTKWMLPIGQYAWWCSKWAPMGRTILTIVQDDSAVGYPSTPNPHIHCWKYTLKKRVSSPTLLEITNYHYSLITMLVINYTCMLTFTHTSTRHQHLRILLILILVWNATKHVLILLILVTLAPTLVLS